MAFGKYILAGFLLSVSAHVLPVHAVPRISEATHA